MARSRVVGAVLFAASVWYVLQAWRSADWSLLLDARPAWLGLGAVSYGSAFVAFSAGIGGRAGESLLPVCEAQLLKYVPGTVWQGRPFVKDGSVATAVGYATAVLLASLVAVAGVLDPWLWPVAAFVLLGVGLVFVRWKGTAFSLRGVCGAVMAAVAVATSGAFVAIAYGADPLPAGRALGAAWGVGVLALPVPSGFGIRELSATAFLGSGAAPLIVVHRMVTLVVDVAVGGTAMFLRTRRPRSPAS